MLRTPSKLVTIIVLIAMIVFLGILPMLTGVARQGGVADARWFKGIVFALVTLFFGMSVQNGLTRGNSIFGMNDVNLLFVSPLRTQAILVYGVSNMLKTALVASLFILFQGSSIGNFGLGFDAVLSLLLGFVVAMVLMSVLTLFIYTLTNGRPRRKLAVKIIAPLIFAPVAICFAIMCVETGDAWASLLRIFEHPVFSWTPVSGWAAEAVFGLAMGQGLMGALWMVLTLAVAAAILVYFSRSNPDYYEDVLVATETLFEKQRAISEGQVNQEALSDRRVRVGRTGLGGVGASALFYKHLRESFRANVLGLWGLSSIIIVGAGIVLCAVSRDIATYALALPMVLMWMQMFLIGTGRGMKEIYSHYIYMIPERSFGKIFWSNLEIVFKTLIESAVLFGVGGILVGAPALLILFCILAYAIYSMLLISVNYVSMRWTGMQINTGLLVFLYMIMVVVAIAPGLVVAVIVGTLIDGIAGMIVGFALLTAWQFIASCICFYLARGVLDKNDMPQVNIMS
jgi:hypothetical protein